MPSPFAVAGAAPQKQTKYAPLFTRRFWTGLYTNRNPLGDPATPYLYDKFYGATRYDALYDGNDGEVSPRLTMKRRAGHSVYNSQTFPPIQAFYDFHTLTAGVERIYVIADTASVVYDATGPATKNAIWNKAAGAGQSYFQGVGDTLYIGDGKTARKWMTSSKAWVAATLYQPGDFIVDGNGNVQMALGLLVDTACGFSIANNLLTLTPTASATEVIVQDQLALSGFTTGNYLNGQTIVVRTANNLLNTYQGGFNHANVGATGDTGVLVDLDQAGTSGGSLPSFSATPGHQVQDGAAGTGLVWICCGPQIQTWGTVAPKAAPALVPTTNPDIFGVRFWAANHVYGAGASQLYCIGDMRGNVQRLVDGTKQTGGSYPVFNTTQGGTTQDGTASWVNCGQQLNLSQQYLGHSQVFAAGATFVDNSGFLQQTIAGGTTGTGGTPPAFSTTVGGTVTDGTITWTCMGTAANFGNSVGWTYYFGFEDVGGNWSNLSPASPATGPIYSGTVNGYTSVISGNGTSSAQAVFVGLFRTAIGGSTPQLLAKIINPGVSVWSFTDIYTDGFLNLEIQGELTRNSPPPSGVVALNYHLNRVWAALGSTVYVSNPPNFTIGVGAECFDLDSTFAFSADIVRMEPVALGMLIFTKSDVGLISGQGTTQSPLSPTDAYIGEVALANYNALCINGSLIHLYTTANEFLSFDPSSGISYLGNNIADRLALFTAGSVYCAYHENGTDTAAYVSDGSTGWYRVNNTPAPETGTTWSPKATIANGISAIASIETVPGTRHLLVGPGLGSGPILQRDLGWNTDTGTKFAWGFTIGGMVLAQDGQMAEVLFISTKCLVRGQPAWDPDVSYQAGNQVSYLGTTWSAVASSVGVTPGTDGTKWIATTNSHPSVSVLLDEVPGMPNSPPFSVLTINSPESPRKRRSKTVYADRFYLRQTNEPEECQALFVKVNFPAEDAPNEVLTYSLFGAQYQEL